MQIRHCEAVEAQYQEKEKKHECFMLKIEVLKEILKEIKKDTTKNRQQDAEEEKQGSEKENKLIKKEEKITL